MSDLHLGLAIIAGLALAVFRCSTLVARHLTPLQRNLLAIAIVSTMVVYSRVVWQSTVLADWLPFSNLIVVGNWFPLFLAALAGIVMEMSQLVWLRRASISVVLAAFSSFAIVLPLLGQSPECGEQWSCDGDCVQSTSFTCSAASAVNLLKMHGISASEQEMAELCLTRHGTSWLGLYRGLKLKTQGTKWDVELVRCDVKDVKRFADRPMIIEVGLDAGTPVDATFRSEFGWAPGMRHSVVLANFAHHHANVVDPSPQIGREEWDDQTLQLLWRGYGLRLVERQ